MDRGSERNSGDGGQAFEHRLLRAAARQVGMGAWYLDRCSGEIHLCAGARALFGLPGPVTEPAECSVKRYAPEHRDRLQEAYRACVDEGTPYDVAFVALTHGGERRWLRTTGEPVHDAEGRVVAVQGALLDIDLYKRREEALVQERDEAERTDRAKSQFLSAMSHELRTPLNAIVGLAQLLNADPEPDPGTRAEYLRHILGAGWHLRDLVGDVLDLARIEAGKTGLTPEPIRVESLVQECMRLVEEQAAERRVHLELACAEGDDGLQVYADRLRAKQVLLNLLSNAIKYNRAGGTVTVRYQREGAESVVIDVADTGDGIPPEGRDALFEAFERLGRERGAVEGAGIGLALALRLARLMGGDLWLVESRPGEGARFRVRLPYVEASGRDRHHAPSVDPGLLEERDDDPPLTVLAAEDNTVNMLLLSGLVAKREGVELLEAYDGASALELAEAREPDLLLIDIHLPDIDGFELARRLRALPALASTPLVALSADATDEARQRALAEGFNDYIVKPFELEQLDALLREVRLTK